MWVIMNGKQFFNGYRFTSNSRIGNDIVTEFNMDKLLLFYSELGVTETFNELKKEFPNVEIKEICFKLET